ETADEDGDAAVAGEEAVSPIEFVAAEQEIGAVLFDQRAAAVVSNGVSHGGAEIAAQRPRDGDPEQLEAAGVNQVPGERHDDLRGQWNAGRLDGHEGDDAQVSAGGDHGDDEAAKRGNDFGDHGVWIIRVPSAAKAARAWERCCAALKRSSTREAGCFQLD